MLRCALAWAKEEPVGAEFALVARTSRRLRAAGVAVHEHALPYRLDYWLETAAGFGWRRELVLARPQPGAWTIAAQAAGTVDLPPPGGTAAALADAVDCDLGLSPLTNTLPVLRLGLLSGGRPHDLLVAWISVPDLVVRPSAQRYTPKGADARGRPVVRYEDADGGFAADLTLDTAGYVLHYPGLARRLGEGER